MRNGKKPGAAPSVEIREERRTLTLEGTPVLTYTLMWPEIAGGGLGGRWINGYYRRLARAWRLRWQREVYWQACIDLAGRSEEGISFLPWSGKLTAEITAQDGDLLSLRLVGEEVRSGGKVCRVRWGDTWSVREGAPLPFRSVLPEGRNAVTARLVEQGEARRTAGDLFLDPGWETALARTLPLRDFCVTETGVELAFPQALFSPAAEGHPVFTLPFGAQ